jgi:8-oxo-dGTP diphosphatase
VRTPASRVPCDSCGAPGCDPECDRCGCGKVICSRCIDDPRLWHFKGGAHRLIKDFPEAGDYAGEQFAPLPTTAKQGYVVGFLFDPSFRRVVLIRKTKPPWQAGKWNGVGGKIESGETPLDAMCREFFEETGMRMASWKAFSVLTGVEVRDNKRVEQNYEVHFFWSCANQLEQAKTQGEEQVENWCLDDVGRTIATVYHLPWLIPMAIAHSRVKDAPAFEVKEINR